MYYLRNKSYIEVMTWFYNNLLDLLTNAITAVVVKLLLCYVIIVVMLWLVSPLSWYGLTIKFVSSKAFWNLEQHLNNYKCFIKLLLALINLL